MTRWQAAGGLLVRRTLHGSVVRVPAGEVLELSPSATALLTLLAEACDADEAATALADASGAPRDVVRRDLEALLPELAAQGVLEETP